MLLKRSPTIEKYLDRASDCELMAKHAGSEGAKRNFTYLAAEWLRAAGVQDVVLSMDPLVDFAGLL